MKKLLMLLGLALGLAATARAYSFKDWVDEAKHDTKAVLGKDISAQYRFNVLDRSQKFSITSNGLAWKFLAVGPALLSPSSIEQQAEIAVNFPIRWKRIPVSFENGGTEIGDLIQNSKIHGWFDRVDITFNLTANLSTGNFEFPLCVSYSF